MSLGKFLKRIWQGVKSFFNALPEKVKALLPTVTNIVNALKEIDDSTILDLATAIIPGDLDDKLRAKFHEWIPKIMLQLEMTEAIANLATPEEQVAAIIKLIKGSHPNKQKVFWTGLASLLMEKITDDDRFSFADAAAVSQYIYKYKLNLPEEQQEPDSDGDGIPDSQDQE